MSAIKSLMKWAGGKSQQLDTLIPLLAPQGHYSQLYDAFGGSGVVSVAWVNAYCSSDNARRSIYNDILPITSIIFEALNSDPEGVKTWVKKLFTKTTNTQEFYLKTRTAVNKSLRDRAAGFPHFIAPLAARLIYLSRHCFNGLIRFNQSGGFNSPFGAYVEPPAPKQQLEDYITAAPSIECHIGDYLAITAQAKLGDIIYADPPFTPISSTANFTTYNGFRFTNDDHKALADMAFTKSQHGVKVLIHNNDLPETRELYKTATEFVEVSVRRSISRSANTRGRVGEIIAIWHPSVAIR